MFRQSECGNNLIWNEFVTFYGCTTVRTDELHRILQSEMWGNLAECKSSTLLLYDQTFASFESTLEQKTFPTSVTERDLGHGKRAQTC